MISTTKKAVLTSRNSSTDPSYRVAVYWGELKSTVDTVEAVLRAGFGMMQVVKSALPMQKAGGWVVTRDVAERK